MSFTAVRLRAPDPRKNWHLRSFVSMARHIYRVPLGQDPGALHIIDNEQELASLRQIPQFEVLTFDDRMAMETFVQQEMERRVRDGGAPVRAQIAEAEPTKRAEPATARRAGDFLPDEDAQGQDGAEAGAPGMRQPEVSHEPRSGARRGGGGRRPAH